MTIKKVGQAIKSKLEKIAYEAQTKNYGVCYQSHYDTLMFSIYGKRILTKNSMTQEKIFIVDDIISKNNEELIAIKKYIIKELNKEFKC